MSTRIIGIRHRIKFTVGGEAKPTQVTIQVGGKDGEVMIHLLEDDQAELDFVRGKFPITKRAVTHADDLKLFAPHHIEWRKAKEGETETVPAHLQKMEEKIPMVASKVPSEYDGLAKGDTVAMVLGGSGDRLAYAIARRSEDIGAKIMRIPPFHLKSARKLESKDDDSVLLARLAIDKPGLFQEIRARDKQLIRVREALRARIETMKARIGCEQRLRQHFIGEIFCKEDGLFPEGSIELAFDEAKANNTILQNFLKEERSANSRLEKELEKLDVYLYVFYPVDGCGPAIASRIIGAVMDIRRFETKAKLKKFCGVHVLPGGKFVRRRTGEVANWHPDSRQALYLLSEQFNRRPGSVWGIKLREYKVKLRAKHPEVVMVESSVKGENGEKKMVKKYTDGHIHKMALWRTVTKFVEHLFNRWWDLENSSGKGSETSPKDTPTTPISPTPEDSKGSIESKTLHGKVA